MKNDIDFDSGRPVYELRFTEDELDFIENLIDEEDPLSFVGVFISLKIRKARISN